MKQIHLLGFSLLLIALTAVMAVGAQEDTTVLPAASIDVNPTTTILAFPARTESDLNELGATIALPSSATHATARILSGTAGGVEIASGIMKQRGVSVVVVRVLEPGLEAIEVEVSHNGSWFAKADDKYASPTLHAGLPGMMDDPAKAAAHPMGGSYVIITAPEFEEIVADLADWKREKGWPVVVATTDVTGSSTSTIKAWLQDAYDNWDRPPEHVLLMGDVEVIPNWLFSGNVSDMPYVLLDGDDWLPDAMIGRFAVANNSEAETIVAKSIAYEMDPYLDQTEWFTRGVMVAGNYGSTTPSRTVTFCNEQLESIGFAGLDTVAVGGGQMDIEGNYIVSPFLAEHGFGMPMAMGGPVITSSVSEGASMVVYRGWARGTDGWEFPEYVQDDIGALTNGSMMPVVMSFVCLNNNYAAPQCFGEAWIREGTPDAFKGGVAFIGNGEHHSHTRHNDAMAISMFERVTDPEVTTLGALLNAGKLRFMDYFPGELTALPGNDEEESVEFYFHIYNLLGDPELNYHRQVPTAITVDHLAQVPTGSNMLSVSAYEADGSTPLTGARVGIVQDSELLGAGFVNDSGDVRIVLAEPAAQGSLTLTVSRADRIPHQESITVGDANAFLAIESLAVGETPDTIIAPGSTLSLVPTIRNYGSHSAKDVSVSLTVEGPATVTQATASLDGLNGGDSNEPTPALAIEVHDDAAHGAFITGRLSITYEDSEGPDVSAFELIVDAPSLVLTSVGAQDGGGIEPGLTTDLALVIVNDGSLDTSGGNLELMLYGPAGVTLLTETASLPAIISGEEGVVSPVSLQVAADVAEGTSLVMQVTATTSEGASQIFSHGFLVGDNASDAPAGPSVYGYYAYDSADYLYPDQRPVYRWAEISTAFGGSGTQLDFYNPEEGIDDNTATDVKVGLPFDFTYFGQTYQAGLDSIRVSDNGWASFDADDDFFNFYNWPIPSTHGNGAVVAPFWDNLTPAPAPDPENDPIGMDSDGVYWLYDADNHELIIEWSRMRFYKPSEIPTMQTFQMVLRDPAHHSTPTGDGEILFFYKQVADIDSIRMFATVGIESPDETDGLQLTYDSVLLNGMAPFGPGHAIRMTTAAPVRVPLDISAFQGRVMGDQVALTWVLNDDRPVVGWRVLSPGDKGMKSLTEEMIPGDARSVTVTAALDDDLVLEAIMPHGASVAAGTLKVGQSIQTSLALGQPRPNPVRGESSIAFALPRAGHMKLRIFDIRGRVVRTLIDGRAEAGDGLVIWKGRDDSGRQLADGVYFYRIEHGGESLTHKLLLVR